MISDSLVHFIELKKRLIRSVFIVISTFLLIFLFSRPLFTLFTAPILKFLPNAYQIISTQVTTPFTVLMRFSFFLSILLTIPVLLYETWGFIAPALYKHERKLFLPLIMLSTGLFYLGGLFAFFIVCPLALNFFYHFAPEGITVMTDLKAYFGFISQMVLIFAFSFQIPIVLFTLFHFEIISVQQYTSKRPYMIVGCFIIGMLFTPPDVISQILLAIPLTLLFELGLLLAKLKKAKPTLEIVPFNQD